MLNAPLRFNHELLKYYVGQGDIAADATVGNGNDTVKLASLVGSLGVIYGFDIQKDALEETNKKLILSGLSQQVQLSHLGHEKMDEVVKETGKVSAVTFNLGYLPKGDKSIITTPRTTIEAIEKSLHLVRRGGIVSIMVYHGHEGGKEEKDALLKYVEKLSQEEYSVLQYQFINQKNSPPFLIAIEKK